MRQFRRLRQILLVGITTEDPNIVLIEVAGLAGCPPPPVTTIYGPEGLFTVQLALCSPLSPPTPQVVHIPRVVEAMDRSGEATRQTRLKGMTEGENERPQT